MNIEFKRLDSLDPNFEKNFSEFEDQFYDILSMSYSIYYGKEYHGDRIKNGKAIIYLGFVENILVAVSYVKRNLRRGGTAVYPEEYRRLGLAKKLVELSLKDFPKQFTILSTNNEHSHKMLALMNKVGFKMATREKEVKEIVENEFSLLSNFRFYNDYFVFDRESEKRETKRYFLTLLYTL
ncbi:MAG: hypothetical protein M0Q21_08180 [Ignavibacteriaceae bacterium]|nr:hypothetical protein [Ignavibacteriaceae bacterium]